MAKREQPESYLITYANPKSPIAESYRSLRTNIHFCSVDRPIQALIVTSSKPSEGKSTTSCNLAISFAQAGHSVLLIDADMRRPRVDKALGLYKRGLTNVLTSKEAESNYKEFIQDSGILPNFKVLTAGQIPPNPSELLGSMRMAALIKKLRDEYDYLLLDTPPLCNVTDAALLSTICDGVLLVLDSGKTEIDAARYAKQCLDNVNANIIGVVLNRVKNKANKYGMAYYNYSEAD